MTNKTVFRLFATTALITSVGSIAIEGGQVVQQLTPSISAQAAENQKTANPLVVNINHFVVTRQDPGHQASKDYTPAHTLMVFEFTENAKPGDTFDIKLSAVHADGRDMPFMTHMSVDQRPVDLKDDRGRVFGRYQVMDDNGMARITLGDNFRPGQHGHVEFNGQTINPYSDKDAKGFNYIRVDATVNGLRANSFTTEMAVKPDEVEWETHSTKVTDIVSKDPIPFEEERIENPDMLVGQENVIQQGVEGLEHTLSHQKVVDGKPVGDPEVEVVVVKEPTKHIIEVGTGVEVEVPFKIDYVEDETVPFTHYEISQRGHFGVSVNNKITVEPINQIIRVGTLRKESSVIAYNTQYVENPDLHVGVKNTLQEGVDGEIVHQHRYALDPNTGELSKQGITTDVTTIEMIPEIIEVGIGVEGVIPYNIIRIPNFDLAQGEEQVIQEGEFGEKWNDDVIKEPIDLIIEYGPLKSGSIPFEVDRIHNPNLKPGEEVVIQEGQVGQEEGGQVIQDPVKQIVEYGEESTTEAIPYETLRRPNLHLDEGDEETVIQGVEGKVDNGKVIQTPINQVVEYGPRHIPFEVEQEADYTLPKGEEKVIREGMDGLMDEEGNVLREPIHQVVAVGQFEEKVDASSDGGEDNQQPVKKDASNETVKKDAESDDEKKQDEVKDKVTEDEQDKKTHNDQQFTTEQNKESVKDTGAKKEEVTDDGAQKPLATNKPQSSTPAPGPSRSNQPSTSSTNRQQPSTPSSTTDSATNQAQQNTQADVKPDQKPDQKPDVKTGVEAVATNPTVIASLVAAIGGIGAAIRFRFKSKK